MDKVSDDKLIKMVMLHPRKLADEDILNRFIIDDLFFSNIDLFIKEGSIHKLIKIIDVLYNKSPKYIIDNYDKIFLSKEADSYLYLSILNCLIFLNFNIEDLLYTFSKNDIDFGENSSHLLKYIFMSSHGDDLFKQYFNYIFRHYNNVLSMRKKILEYGGNPQILDLVLDNNLYIVILDMACNALELSIADLKKEGIYDFLVSIIDELVKHDNINYHDITYIGHGHFNYAYQIGSKVLKIGTERKNFHIANNKRFLKPLYRQEIRTKDDSKVLFCIEITEMVYTDNITDEDVYQVYSELRRQGLYWIDAKRENLGRLKRDNKTYFSGIDYVSRDATGYLDDCDIILPNGDLVILDNDYILTEEELEKDKDLRKYIADLEHRFLSESSHNKKK